MMMMMVDGVCTRHSWQNCPLMLFIQKISIDFSSLSLSFLFCSIRYFICFVFLCSGRWYWRFWIHFEMKLATFQSRNCAHSPPAHSPPPAFNYNRPATDSSSMDFDNCDAMEIIVSISKIWHSSNDCSSINTCNSYLYVLYCNAYYSLMHLIATEDSKEFKKSIFVLIPQKGEIGRDRCEMKKKNENEFSPFSFISKRIRHFVHCTLSVTLCGRSCRSRAGRWTKERNENWTILFGATFTRQLSRILYEKCSIFL